LHIAEQGLPGNSELIRWKAYILRRRGGWNDALRDLQRARALDPRDSEAVTEVAFTLLNLRRYDEAASVYEDALALAPDYPAALTYQGMIPLLRDGTVASARETMIAIEQVSEVPWKYAHGWQAAICAGDFEQAEALARRVERVAGQWHEYPQALLLGWTLLLQGREQEAQPHFQEAAAGLRQDLQERPDDPRLYASLALSLAGLGQFEEALDQANRSVEIMPTERDIFVGNWMLQELAWVHVMAGNTKEAVETLDRILSVPSVWSVEALLIDPRVAPIRESAEFQALVDKHRQRS
jgi:tetratricopeptide (TPR) repeat protein